MAIFYPTNEPLTEVPEGHEFVREFEITCYSTDGEAKQVKQYQYKYAVGRVVRTGEYNGYHDSDFYAVYMTENGEFTRTEYASTRYPCSGCGADVDATPEVLEAYEKHCERLAAEKRAHARKRLEDDASELRVTPDELSKLRRTYSSHTLKACERLLKTKTFRSKFRESLCNQLREWLADENPRYAYPFSPRQLECLR